MLKKYTTSELLCGTWWLCCNLTFVAVGLRNRSPRMHCSSTLRKLNAHVMHVWACDSSCMVNKMIPLEKTSQAQKPHTFILKKNILGPQLTNTRLTELLVPNSCQPHSWVVVLSMELHVKQQLQCSVLQLSVNNKMLPACSGHEMYTAALWLQFHFYSSAVKGEKVSRGYAR